MIPVQFDYAAATSVEEALRFLATHPGASVVAGGTDLIPALSRRRIAPSALLDLSGLSSLASIEPLLSGGMRLGALVTLSEMAADMALVRDYPALADAAAVIADPQVRNRATVGGSLAQTGAGGDLAAALIAVGASASVAEAGGSLTIPVDVLVAEPLDAARIITGVDLPAPAPGSAYEKLRHPGSGYALCGIAAFVQLRADGTVGACRLAVTGATAVTQRLAVLEAAIGGQPGTSIEVPVDVLHRQQQSLQFVDDHAASAQYRAHLTGVLAGRALRRAALRAAGSSK